MKRYGGWGKLHNEELHNLYSSPNIIRIIIKPREGEMSNTYSTHGIEEEDIGSWIILK
jgi:hypothetical protein